MALVGKKEDLCCKQKFQRIKIPDLPSFDETYCKPPTTPSGSKLCSDSIVSPHRQGAVPYFFPLFVRIILCTIVLLQDLAFEGASCIMTTNEQKIPFWKCISKPEEVRITVGGGDRPSRRRRNLLVAFSLLFSSYR